MRRLDVELRVVVAVGDDEAEFDAGPMSDIPDRVHRDGERYATTVGAGGMSEQAQSRFPRFLARRCHFVLGLAEPSPSVRGAHGSSLRNGAIIQMALGIR